MISNFRFVLKKLLILDPRTIIAMLIQIPLIVIVAFAGIYLPKVVINELENPITLQHLIMTVSAVAGILIIATLLEKRVEAIVHWGSARLRMEFMKLLIKKMCDVDYETLEQVDFKNKSQEYASENCSQWGQMEQALPSVRNFASDLIGFVFYGIVIFTISPLLIVLVIITAGVNAFFLKKLRGLEESLRKDIAKADRENGYALSKANDFSMGKDIRLYQMKKWILAIYYRCLNQATLLRNRVFIYRLNTSWIDLFLIAIRDAIAYGYLIYLAIHQNMSVSNIVLYLGVIGGLSNWFFQLIKDIHELDTTSRVIHVMRTLLDYPDRFNRGSGVKLPLETELPCEIRFDHVSYQYPNAEKPTIKDINLTIKPGEKLSIVGVNGAGKTTLIKMLCGFYRPTSGRIFVNGHDIKDYNRDDYYKLIAAVFQDVKFIPATIKENIFNGSDYDENKLLQCLELAGMKERILEFNDGIESLYGKGIIENAVDFSGGELQKLILARALYKNAPILVLDEPTAALDPIAEYEMYLKYAELTKGRTSVFISHRLSSTRFCDRIILMENGRIIEEGNHEELMNFAGIYANMFEIQSSYYKKETSDKKTEHPENDDMEKVDDNLVVGVGVVNE